MCDQLVLLPAVDIRHGEAVQLVQGIDGSEHRFGDPVAAAMRWHHAGAQWLHLVNLDAAFGDVDSTETVAAVVAAATNAGMCVELSGGIRDDATLRVALDTGCARVNIGTAAIENPLWCAQVIADFGDKIALAIDVKDGRLAGRGWRTAGPSALDTVRQFAQAGCARFVVTDIDADGTLSGPNLSMLREVCDNSGAKVVASGGIATLEQLSELDALVPYGLEGAIIGTALYLGNIDLAAALELTQANAIKRAMIHEVNDA